MARNRCGPRAPVPRTGLLDAGRWERVPPMAGAAGRDSQHRERSGAQATDAAPRRVLGWYFFDWASQPYSTLLLTFLFAPYIEDILGDGSAAQAAWGYGVGAAGLAIAVLAPILGSVADRGPGRMPFVWVFSAFYVVGAASTWLAHPEDPNLVLVLALFALGLLGMECATIFTNAMLPDLGPRRTIGRISGTGWAFGYLGGLVALVLALFFLAENGEGRTLLGLAPAFGLDPEAREGTRAVGPAAAVWFVLFMVPFFLWVREAPRPGALGWGAAARAALPDVAARLRSLPRTPSLAAFLGASMLYRDALNGMYVFGGLYAAGVLGWSVIDTGIFGILAVATAAFAAWIGGRADARFGPKPVIVVCLVVLTLVAAAIVFVSRERLFGLPVPAGSAAPDLAFYVLGAALGAAGGALQAASRTMMVHQAPEGQTTQAFGLYALAGKATAFVAPLSIAAVTDLTGSQQAGVTPLIVLFLGGLVLLAWAKPDGDRADP